MPAADKCEPQIISALKKAGFAVVKSHFSLRTGKSRRYVYADLLVRDIASGTRILVIEVKCSTDPNTVMDEFYRIVGQYQVYQIALERNGLDFPLYLAMPEQLHNEIIGDAVLLQIIEQIKVKRIVVNIETEEIIQWQD